MATDEAKMKMAALLGLGDDSESDEDEKALATKDTPSAGQDGGAMEESAVPLVCDVCNELPRVYKCPRCALHTCSLSCCRRHKEEKGCNGIRDKAEYVSVRDFKEKTLRNDYHFLEDVLQTKDRAKRTLTQAFGGVRYERACGGAGGTRGRGKKQPKVVVEMDEPEKGNGLGLGGGGAEQVLDMHTQGVKKLVRAARQRDTQMIVMSLGMSRRTQNTSKFLPKSDELFWRVQLVFVAAAPNSRTPGSQHAFPASALLHSSLECLHDGGLSIGKSSAVAVASAPANVKGNNAPGSEGSSSSSSSSNGGVTAATAAATAATAVALMAPQSPLVGMCISACHENTSLRDILNRFLDPPNNNNNNNNNNGSNNGPKQEDNAVQRHALRYLRQNREKVVCLLQSVPSPASDPVFVEVGGLLLGLDGEGEGGGAAAGESASSIQKDDGTLDRSLRAALQGQAVIEYPTLVFGVQTDLAHVRRPVAIIRGDSPVELTLSGAVGVSDGMITEEGSTSLTPRVAGISVEEVGEEQEEEEEEDDEEADAEFMKEVVELYSADIADLKKIIASEEA